MWASVACQALRDGKCLELRYDGFSRIVEVHAVGFSKEGHGLMRVWQVSGGSVSNEPIGWKMFRLDEAFSAHLTTVRSLAPRQGYRRGDAAMKAGITCQI